jgi:hypothetical protein
MCVTLIYIYYIIVIGTQSAVRSEVYTINKKRVLLYCYRSTMPEKAIELVRVIHSKYINMVIHLGMPKEWSITFAVTAGTFIYNVFTKKA